MASFSPEFLRAYLKRVGHSNCDVLPPPTLHTLSLLHRDHLRSIPFENLSLKVPQARAHDISVDYQAIFKKLVVSRRGGYCFEQNGLLGAALRGLGFDVTEAAARVVQAGGEAAEEVEEAPPLPSRTQSCALGINEPTAELRLSGHDHRILLVRLEDQIWLADVGFGGESLPLPLLLPPGAELYAPPEDPPSSPAAVAGTVAGTAAGTAAGAAATAAYEGQDWAAGLPVDRLRQYRLRLGLPGLVGVPDAASTPHFATRAGYYLQKQSSHDGRWKDLYFFRLDEFLPQDFAMQNYYIKSNPESHFQKNLVVALHTPQGRVTILNDTFRVWGEPGGELLEERTIGGEAELLELLRTHFGISL